MNPQTDGIPTRVALFLAVKFASRETASHPARLFNVIGTLVAIAFAWQDPSPPNVILPEGWHVHYWSSAGFGTGALLGPDGEEIMFPGYEETGYVAETTHETDPNSLLISTLIGGRLIDVAARADGYLAVSYLPSSTSSRSGSFDYWTRTKTPKQAVTALAIALSRLEVFRSKAQDSESPSENGLQFAPRSVEFPFENLSVSQPIQYLGGPNPHRIGFETRDGAIVEFQSQPPSKSKWEEKRSFGGREIRWGEDNLGRTWASSNASGTRMIVFVSSKANVQGTVLAILMAMTYRVA